MFRKMMLGIDRICRATSWFGIALYTILIVILIMEIIMRYVFNAPMIWASEACKWIIIMISYLCFAWVLLVDGHVKVDIVLEAVGVRNRAILIMINSFIGMLWAIMNVYLCWILVRRSYRFNIRTEDLHFPAVILHSIVVAGFVLLCLQFLSRLYRNYSDLVSSADGRKVQAHD